MTLGLNILGITMLTRIARDMANIDVDWEVEGIITAPESVSKMLKVIDEKDKSQSGTFWCWDGRVCLEWPYIVPTCWLICLY